MDYLRFHFFLKNSSGTGLTGKAGDLVFVFIRESDGYFYDFVHDAFIVSAGGDVVSQAISELNASRMPGIYYSHSLAISNVWLDGAYRWYAYYLGSPEQGMTERFFMLNGKEFLGNSFALEANVQTHAAAALTAYDPPTKAELDRGLVALPHIDDSIKAQWAKVEINRDTGAYTVYNLSGTVIMTGSLTEVGNLVKRIPAP